MSFATFMHRNGAGDRYRMVLPGMTHVLIEAGEDINGARHALDRFLGLSAGTDRYYGDFIVLVGDSAWTFSVQRPNKPEIREI